MSLSSFLLKEEVELMSTKLVKYSQISCGAMEFKQEKSSQINGEWLKIEI